MRRGSNIKAVVLVGLMALAFSTSGALARPAHGAPDDSQWEVTFHAGLDQIPGNEDCRELDECKAYEGIALVDIDVSPHMDGSMTWNFDDKGLLAVWDWRMCHYDSSGTRIGSCEDFQGAQGEGGLPGHTATVRLILVDGAEREAIFDID